MSVLTGKVSRPVTGRDVVEVTPPTWMCAEDVLLETISIREMSPCQSLWPGRITEPPPSPLAQLSTMTSPISVPLGECAWPGLVVQCPAVSIMSPCAASDHAKPVVQPRLAPVYREPPSKFVLSFCRPSAVDCGEWRC